MANNLIQVKRTSVSGRAANTTTLTNAGELALNMTDGIMYSTNGSVVFEIGANTTNSKVTGNLTIKGIIANGSLGTSGYVLKSNGSAAYWDSDGADVGAANQILYRNSSNVLTSSSGLVYDGVSIKVNGNLESVYQNGSEGGEIFLSKPASGTTLSGTGVTIDIYENKIRFFENGGTVRGAYIDLTGTSAGVGTNLVSGGGGGSVNTSAQYTWTNTHIFQANVAFNGNNITVVSNTGSVMFAGTGDTNWRIGRSTGAFTKRFYTNNSLDFIAANSNLEGIAFGYTGSEVYLETGYNGTYTKNPVYIGTVNSTSNGIVVGTTSINIGNSSVNSTINSTSFSGTSNNSSNLNGKAESALNVNSALTANNSTNLGGTAAASFVQNTDSRTLSGNLNFTGANLTVTGNLTIASTGELIITNGAGIIANSTLGSAGQVLATNGTSVYWTNQLAGNVSATAITTNTLSANFMSISTGTLTVGNSTVNTDIGNNYVSVGNSSSYVNVYSSYIYIGNSSANATVNSTIYTGTANNASYLGGTIAAAYVQNTDSRTLSGNLIFSGANVVYNSGLKVGANVIANLTNFFVGNSTVNTNISAGSISVNGAVVANNSGIFAPGTINAASYTVGTTLIANATAIYFGTINATSNGVVVNATSFVVGNSSVNATINSTAFTGTALSSNNASFLGGTAAASFVQNTDSRTLSGNLNFTGANNNVSGNLTIASTGELIITNGAGIYANGGLGTSGQVLTTNGSGVYWSNLGAIREQFTGNGSNTTFTVTGGYTANSLSVFINGVLVRNGVDVNVTNGSTISFTVAPPNSALIDVIGNQSFAGVSPSFSDAIVANFLTGL